MLAKISIFLLAFFILTASCGNEDKEKQSVDVPKDSVAADKTAKAPVDSNKTIDTTSAAPSGSADRVKDASKRVKDAVDHASEKIKKDANAVVKKAVHKADSAVNAKKSEAAEVVKKDLSAATDKLSPASTADNSKSFAPKYGLIPWDANENNITAFKNAFPDKQTLVKVNFDADPDAQMQTEKTQVLNALKKAGYKNVSDQSQTFHPTRIPKDIHYELQRDGSVIIWLPPTPQQ